MFVQSSTNIIKKSIIVAVLQNKPKFFFHHLMSNKVISDYPNKIKLYISFTSSLNDCYDSSKGPLFLKIENSFRNSDQCLNYCFYDSSHKYPRLTIFIESINKHVLYMDILPF
jgi:hypothetical protein